MTASSLSVVGPGPLASADRDPEIHAALVEFWAQLFVEVYQRNSDVTVGTPGGIGQPQNDVSEAVAEAGVRL